MVGSLMSFCASAATDREREHEAPSSTDLGMVSCRSAQPAGLAHGHKPAYHLSPASQGEFG